MRNRNALAYGLLAVIVALGVVGAVLVLGRNDSKSTAKPSLSPTQRAGLALTRDFNRAEASNGIRISQIKKCLQDPKNPTRFGCLAVVTNGSKAICGQFIFKMVGSTTKPESVKAVAAQNCQ